MKRPTPVKQIFAKAGKTKEGKSKSDDEATRRLGGAVSSAGYFDTKAKDIRQIFKTYSKGNSSSKMEEGTKAFMNSICSGKLLKGKLEIFLGKYMKGIDDVARMIPSILQADRKLMTTLNTEMSETIGNLRTTYPTLISDCVSFQGELDMFYVVQLMSADYRVRDLQYDRMNTLGSGSFADVYKGVLKPIGINGIDVALKIAKTAVTPKTVTDILLEDRTLRYRFYQ